GVTASADGKRVYVANSNSDSLSVIDAAGLVVIATLPAGRDPEGLTFNRDGTLLYVVNENDSAVTVIDVASSRIVKKIEVGTDPGQPPRGHRVEPGWKAGVGVARRVRGHPGPGHLDPRRARDDSRWTAGLVDRIDPRRQPPVRDGRPGRRHRGDRHGRRQGRR